MRVKIDTEEQLNYLFELLERNGYTWGNNRPLHSYNPMHLDLWRKERGIVIVIIGKLVKYSDEIMDYDSLINNMISVLLDRRSRK